MWNYLIIIVHFIDLFRGVCLSSNVPQVHSIIPLVMILCQKVPLRSVASPPQRVAHLADVLHPSKVGKVNPLRRVARKSTAVGRWM